MGFRFTVVADDPNCQPLLDRLFAGLAAGDLGGEANSLHVGARSLAGDLVGTMSRINLAAIDHAAGNLLLHAAAVSDDDGRAAVVCGRSGSGKTTLAVRLVEQGLSYLTDETVCVDPATLRLHPYRKPAVVKAGSQAALRHLQPDDERLASGSWLIPPSAFESTALAPGPHVPTLLVFPTYESTADLSVERLCEAEAAYLLGKDSSRLADVRGGPLPALARLARRAPSYRLVHGDAVRAADAVRDLLEAA